MNYEETLSTLKAIQASYSPVPFLLDPEAEPRFVINSDERTIVIPEEFKFLAVKMDHLSERIYFDIPRYFDGEDLATKICVVQYINANSEEAVEGIAAVVDVDYTSESGKIIFRWDVDNNVTKYAGDVSFSVRFYTISDDNRFTYSWNTVPATLPILDTIDNTGQTVTENYPTELLQWQYRMTELDRTISDKISEATESIDTNVAAALAARQGAEDAEARVNAIVAGNEAYTKQQSHDLFALALKSTAEKATSVNVYPDKLSNLRVYAHGFTQQAGSGDPSPTNVREITCGGLRMIEVVFDGTENWVPAPSASGSDPAFAVTDVAFPFSGTNEVLARTTQFCTGYPIKNSGGYSGECVWVYGEQAGSAGIRVRLFGAQSAEQLKSALVARYAAGDPVIVWYQPADESDATGLYAPIILQGDEYRATCIELTAPLCKGDSVVSYIESGCDDVVTYDGSEDEGWNAYDGNPGVFYIDISAANYASGGIAIANRLIKNNSGVAASLKIGEFIIQIRTGGTLRFAIKIDDTSTDPSVVKTALAANPVDFFFTSTNYTPAADIPVSLETHAAYFIRLDGVTNGLKFTSRGNLLENTVELRVGNIQGVRANGILACSNLKPFAVTWGENEPYICGYGGSYPYEIAIRLPNTIATTIEAANQWLTDQKNAGTPITIVYELATTITYAHPAVRLPAYPDDTGKVTITGQSGGKVSVEYNKNITKAFEDIVTRLVSVEKAILGG